MSVELKNRHICRAQGEVVGCDGGSLCPVRGVRIHLWSVHRRGGDNAVIYSDSTCQSVIMLYWLFGFPSGQSGPADLAGEPPGAHSEKYQGQ